METRKSRSRFATRLIWMIICSGLGVMFFFRGEIAMGTGLISGAAAGSIAELIRLRKRRKLEENGEVLYDERDIQVAGQAAILTVRIVMAITAVVLLAVVVTDMYWSPPILPVLGITLGIVSLSYSVLYRVLRNRDAD